MYLYNKISKKILITIYCICINNIAFNQTKPIMGINDTIPVQGIIYNEEWMPYKEIETIDLYAQLSDEQKRKRQEWYKLKRTVYLTYPYMKAVSSLINDINVNKLSIKNPKELEQFMKTKELELKEKFTDRLINMTTYQGKVLIKLIHRETGITCYEVIKMYKGTTTAITWQTLALLFGNSLTKKYNPQGEDMEMESLVQEAKKIYGF